MRSGLHIARPVFLHVTAVTTLGDAIPLAFAGGFAMARDVL